MDRHEQFIFNSDKPAKEIIGQFDRVIHANGARTITLSVTDFRNLLEQSGVVEMLSRDGARVSLGHEGPKQANDSEALSNELPLEERVAFLLLNKQHVENIFHHEQETQLRVRTLQERLAFLLEENRLLSEARKSLWNAESIEPRG